jgi:hypothetical protein
MTPSYNVGDFLFNMQCPPAPHTKERRDLFDTASIASSQTSPRASITFRGKGILLMGLGILTSIIILVVGLAVQVFVTHEFVYHGLQIITAAPLGSTLAIVHALAVLLILTIPLVVRLESYRLAWAWLVASVDSGHNRPTPFQRVLSPSRC